LFPEGLVFSAGGNASGFFLADADVPTDTN